MSVVDELIRQLFILGDELLFASILIGNRKAASPDAHASSDARSGAGSVSSRCTIAESAARGGVRTRAALTRLLGFFGTDETRRPFIAPNGPKLRERVGKGAVRAAGTRRGVIARRDVRRRRQR